MSNAAERAKAQLWLSSEAPKPVLDYIDYLERRSESLTRAHSLLRKVSEELAQIESSTG